MQIQLDCEGGNGNIKVKVTFDEVPAGELLVKREHLSHLVDKLFDKSYKITSKDEILHTSSKSKEVQTREQVVGDKRND